MYALLSDGAFWIHSGITYKGLIKSQALFTIQEMYYSFINVKLKHCG
jgi:hypothetical protein